MPDEAAILRRLGGATGSTPPGRVLRLILEKGVEITRADRGDLYRWDAERKRLLALAEVTRGEPFKGELTGIGKREGISYWAAKAGQPFLSHGDVRDDGRYVGYEEVRAELTVPLIRSGDVLGVLNVESRRVDAFTREDQRRLEAFASQAVVALGTENLLRNLQRQVKELEALTVIGRTVSTLELDAILRLIYGQVREVMDATNFYIALYDKEEDTVRFGFAYTEEDGIIRWGVRERDGQTLELWAPRPKQKRYGITNYVIEHCEPVLIENVLEWSRQHGIDYSEKRPAECWVGAPMVVGTESVGMISVYSLEKRQHLYDEGHKELLWTIASQAAIAIENARLLKEKDRALELLRQEQSKSVAMARLAAVNVVAGEFVHRMNNIVGTIPVRVEQIKELLDPGGPNYSTLTHYLDGILEDANGILEAAVQIRASTETVEPIELVDINELVSTAISRVAIPSHIKFEVNLASDLPPVLAYSGSFVGVFQNFIQNSVQALGKQQGLVVVRSGVLSKEGQEWVAVSVEDNGPGILPENLPRIFDLFFSTRPEGMGFGLWRAKALVESLGGKVDVSSTVGRGTTFAIRLLAEKEE